MKKPHIAALTFTLGLSPFAPMGALAAAAHASSAASGPVSSYDDRAAYEARVEGSSDDARTAAAYEAPGAAGDGTTYAQAAATPPVAVEREVYVPAPRETIVVSPPFDRNLYDARHPHWGHLHDHGLFNRVGPNDFGR